MAPKKHRKGKKAQKGEKEAKHNPRAFTFSGGAISVGRRVQRTMDMKAKKERAEIIDKVSENEAPPFVVVVQGPPGCGKTTLIRSLVKHYTKQNLGTKLEGPVTMVTGRLRRLTFIECSNDMTQMIDLAKIADLVMLMVDASYGFELETFEFLNIMQVHGMPKVMGILTHLDKFKETKQIRQARKKLKSRFWTEIYDGAKMFYLSGLQYGNRYNKTEIMNLCRFLSVQKFTPLTWRQAHPYLLGLHWEDKTLDPDSEERDLAVYGYVNGCRLRPNSDMHLPGLGDFTVTHCEKVLDPCPSAQSVENARREQRAKDFSKAKGASLRTLSDRHRAFYAPGCDGANVTVDAESMYINIPDHKVGFTKKKKENEEEDDKEKEDDDEEEEEKEEGEEEDEEEEEEDEEDEDIDPESAVGMVRSLQKAKGAIDSNLQKEENDFEIVGGRKRRPWRFTDPLPEGEEEGANEEGSDLEESESENDEEEEEEEEEEEKAESGNKTVEAALARWQSESTGPSLEDLIYNPKKAEADGEVDEVSNKVTTHKVMSLFEEEDEEEEEGEAQGKKVDNSVDSFKVLIEGLEEGETWEEYISDLRLRKFFVAKMIEEELNAENDEEDFEKSRERLAAEKEAAMLNPREEGEEEAEENGQGDKKKTKKEIEASLDDGLSIPIGSYCRLFFRGIPKECVEQLAYTRPLVLGGVLPAEKRVGELQMKVKKHRWHKKLLKTQDALLMSIGWRRFQTLPVFCMEDRNNVRVRMLKYTPEHMHSLCTAYGPITPPGAGVLGVKTWAEKVSSFRIALTGQVLENSEAFKVVKKLKLVGEPAKIYKKTAFITGMFNSDLEVAKCLGSKIQTVSGIRGEIKKPHGDRGDFRASFEDRVLKSDLVILKAWAPIDIPHTYIPMLDVPGWTRIKTMAELRRERQVPVEIKKDSEYKKGKQERPEKRKFNALHVPLSLQRALPFQSKAKILSKSGKNTREHLSWTKNKLAVVRSEQERKEATLIQHLQMVKKERLKTRKESAARKLAEKEKKNAFVQGLRDEHSKEARKRKLALESKQNEAKQKKMKLN